MAGSRVHRVLETAAGLAGAKGWKAYLVGGAVRRLVRGQELAAQRDVDIVVDSPHSALALGEALCARIPECRSPALISSFPTVELRCDDLVLQISEPLQGPEADISEVKADLSELMKFDALRRDFTINTLLVPLDDLRAEAVVDPLTTGLHDMQSHTLRTPVDPQVTLEFDPIRMLRAVRFTCTEGFACSIELRRAIKENADKIADMPGERIGQEFSRIITCARPGEALRNLLSLGLLEQFLPEVACLAGVEQPTEYHGDDVLSHTLKVVDAVEPALTVRLAALLHDVGKDSCRELRAGRATFHGHQYSGAERAREILERLRYSGAITGAVVSLVQKHMIAYRPEWTDRAVRRFVRSAGRLLDPLMELYRADILARRPPHDSLEDFEHLRGRIGGLDVEQIRQVRSPLRGEEVMSLLGIGEGPQVGEAQRAVEAAIVDGKIEAERQAAVDFLLHSYAPRRFGAQ